MGQAAGRSGGQVVYEGPPATGVRVGWKETGMTKQDLIDAVAKSTGLSKRGAAGAVEATISGIAKGIKKDKRLSLSGFGTFTVRKRRSRIGRNPRTGEEIKISASKTVGFKPAPALKMDL